MQEYSPMFIKEHCVDGHSIVKQVRKLEPSDLIIKCNSDYTDTTNKEIEALFTGNATDLLYEEIRATFVENVPVVPKTLSLLFKDSEYSEPQKFASYIEVKGATQKVTPSDNGEWMFDDVLEIGAFNYQAALEQANSDIAETIQVRLNNILLVHNQLYANALLKKLTSDTHKSEFVNSLLTDFDKANININTKAISELQELIKLTESEIKNIRRSSTNIRVERFVATLNGFKSSDNQAIFTHILSQATSFS